MIAIVGTGSWGTTLAIALAQEGHNVTLLARSEDEAQALREAGENRRFLPGTRFPESLVLTGDAGKALAGRQLVLLVVPAQTMRQNARRLRPHLGEEQVLVSCAKGLELATGRRMSEVLQDELGASASTRIAALSGPNLSGEVARGLPTATVVAARDERVAQFVQEELRLSKLRVYTNPDLIGVELAGALKNVIALGAGICDGLGYGDNAKAALLTRGLAEIARLGLAMGANPLTFAGLAGVGDLMATCASRLSRNRHFGEELGRGRPLAEIQTSMDQVAEGVPTTAAAKQLANRFGVEMPIAERMYAVLFSGASPRAAVAELMTRDPKDELAGMIAKPRGD
ncbi:MAG: NAD(P)H-dependent glycerol-3-phosphate dehydrogenase [Chloroflexota bacterium]